MTVQGSLQVIASLSMTALDGSTTTIALPTVTGATAVRVTNFSGNPVAVAIGATALSVGNLSSNNATVLRANSDVLLTLGTALYIGALSLGMGNAQLNVSTVA